MPKIKKPLALLLDTHVWVWLNIGSPELDSNIIESIDKAAFGGEIYISAISIWEIATLVAKKRLILQTSVKDWIDKALTQAGIQLLPLSPDIAIESTQLPNGHSGDPADRIIVASARLHNLTLMSRDHRINAYGKAGFVKVRKV
jgi:PIN domain nuclease of toxin-antitoxin system